MKKFDLNIEKVLEDWEVYHATREIIANALDEQALTNSSEIKIFKENDKWHIRDFGRGIKYEHLTQNESDEKLKFPEKVIGKFGVGLKDAFATFDRKNIKVLIKSKYSDITLGKSSKKDFEDIMTLHALVSVPSNPSMNGTDFILDGIKDEDIELAKEFFLKFSNETELEKTQYGSVLKKHSTGKIYINGLRVAEEENFLFSYNITSITTKIKKSLNRERTNVGRSAYTDRVKSILLECEEFKVAETLVNDLEKFELGESHDELSWIDVSVHACKLLNSKDKVIFLTPYDLSENQTMVDRAKRDNIRIVTIPENVKYKIRGQEDTEGNIIRDIDEYASEWNNSFEFSFIDEKLLSNNEKEIFSKKNEIFELIGGKPKKIKNILISETMRLESQGYQEAVGLWEEHEGRIIIRRDQLSDLSSFAGVLLHETAHAICGYSDITIEFENQLTSLLGIIAEKKIKKSFWRIFKNDN